ncbi:hypothetical protein PAAG_11154 [Paracoccidioides lutzii Pb01]|uniref:PWI domain-containing protein n=1 Tax=Paracoccidioides lutzii (strain ATCC MYA-826 / Pb01) TaxID=502779 RepID=A0A0A2V2F2_PARBA|nr:hypothetical protein PAAG_11154 [Paracoccidioides lutzii Pb01]KGQ01981.1 hypothetical protein PAAG_11154 [Paracoccidioides lutzii Pb01]
MATTVEAKLRRQTKFPPEFAEKVDMTKVNIEVMKKWIAGKISGILGNEDDVVIELCFNLLEGSRFPDIKLLQIQLTGFLDKDTPKFCKELWNLCLSAQTSPLGVPKELLEAKKQELKQEKLESERQAEEARRRREEERMRERELEVLRQRERAERGRGGGRDRWGDRDARSPPRRRSLDRFRDGPARRKADTWAPSGGRSSRWAEDRGRCTSRPISLSPSRSTSRSSPSPSPHRKSRGRHRPHTRRRRSLSSSRSSDRRDLKRRRRRSPDRDDDQDTGEDPPSTMTAACRAPAPPSPRNSRYQRHPPSISRSRSRSRSSSRRRSRSRTRGKVEKRSEKGGRWKRSPSYNAKNDRKGESRADNVGKDHLLKSREDRRRLSRSRSRSRSRSKHRHSRHRRRRSPSRSRSISRSHSRSRSRSPFRDCERERELGRCRSRSPVRREHKGDRKRHQSIERYAPAARRRRNKSASASPPLPVEKRQVMADSHERDKREDEDAAMKRSSTSPGLRNGGLELKEKEDGKVKENEKEKAMNTDEKPAQPLKARLTGTELRERLAREKVKALRRESAEVKANASQTE